MATTQATVCNVALGMIGEQAIAGITDDNPRANALNTQWEPVLREVLASAPWKFAKDRATLAQSLAGPEFGYRFQYNLPSNYITLISLNSVQLFNQVSDLYDTENGKILTDEAEAKIEYVFMQEDTSKWDPLFSTAVARLLASRVASQIRQDGVQLGQVLEGRYYTVDLPRARMKNASLNRKTPYNLPANSKWNASRYRSTRG